MMSNELEVKVISPIEIEGIGLKVKDLFCGFDVKTDGGKSVYIDDEIVKAMMKMIENRNVSNDA